jgi:hypothetical protein
MLPTHRNMRKDGKGSFYNDDKYEKSNNKNGFSKASSVAVVARRKPDY